MGSSFSENPTKHAEKREPRKESESHHHAYKGEEIRTKIDYSSTRVSHSACMCESVFLVFHAEKAKKSSLWEKKSQAESRILSKKLLRTTRAEGQIYTMALKKMIGVKRT